MIRQQARMPTLRFTTLFGIPERSYRRWQAKARDDRPARGPWPTPAQDQFEEIVVELADRWPGVGSPQDRPDRPDRPHRRPPRLGFHRPQGPQTHWAGARSRLRA